MRPSLETILPEGRGQFGKDPEKSYQDDGGTKRYGIYEERLTQTRLVTLEARRTRADIIEVFKIMKGLEGLNREDFFEMEVDKR